MRVFFQSSHRSDTSKLIEMADHSCSIKCPSRSWSFFFLLPIFWGRGKGLARSFVGRVRSLHLVVYSLHLSSASVRIDGFLRGGRIVFMFAMAGKVRSKAVQQLSKRSMWSARFGHGSAFSSGGRSFFCGGGGRVCFSFSCWALRALARTDAVSGDAFWCFGI